MSASVSSFALGSELLFVALNTLRPSLDKFKRLLTGCLAVGLGASLWISTVTMAWADNTSPGELFEIHCAGCHPNGTNIIRRGKNLKQRALQRQGYESVHEIAALITNGKGLMSAYGDQLSEDEITNLANYVLEQAAVNWKPAK